MTMLEQTSTTLLDATLLLQALYNLIQHTIYEGAAGRRRVVLCDVDPLVESNLYWNRLKVGELSNSNRDDEVIHKCDALYIPVASKVVDNFLVVRILHQRLDEKSLCELKVILALELWKDFNIRMTLLE